MTPFNYSAGNPAGYRISGKTDLPANSVSGATLRCMNMFIPVVETFSSTFTVSLVWSLSYDIKVNIG